jgi:hypothetical protein
MTELSGALERSRELIEHALTEARAELASLDERRAELLEQIAQAEAIVAREPAAQVPAPPAHLATTMTLHEALARVLEDTGNEWTTARELADDVNRRGLYRKRDGSPVEVNQVHARTNNYTQLFEKDGPKIRLKKGATVIAPHRSDVVMFKDDDEGFFEWQESNPGGVFINTERKPNPNYLVQHRSGCPHFKDSASVRWTTDYVKICSGDRGALDEWARATVGGEVTLCGTCYGQ